MEVEALLGKYKIIVLFIFVLTLNGFGSDGSRQHASTGNDDAHFVENKCGFSLFSRVSVYLSKIRDSSFRTGQQATTIAVTEEGFVHQSAFKQQNLRATVALPGVQNHAAGHMETVIYRCCVWGHLFKSDGFTNFYFVAVLSKNSSVLGKVHADDVNEPVRYKIDILYFELRTRQFDPVCTVSISEDLYFHTQMHVPSMHHGIYIVRKDFVEMQPQRLFVYRDISVASTTALADCSSQTCLTANTNVAPKPRPPNDTELNMTRLKRTVSDTTLMQNVPNNSSALRRYFASRRPHNSGRPLKNLPHKQLLHQHRWIHISVMQLYNFVFRHLLLAVTIFLHLVFAGKYSRYKQVENSTKIPPKGFLRSVLKTFFQRFICVKENSKYWLCKSILDDSSCGLSEKYDQTFFYGKLHHDTCSTGNGTDRLKGRLSTLARQLNIVTWPVTRFLPDTTNNPALDLAHLGYRLATLSAVPPSVPVSRVRLADAGFYYRGQGDEMICYKCQKRHSGWTNQENPMEVHRRISPDCPHVLERDRTQLAPVENRPLATAPTPSPAPSSVPHQMASIRTASANNNPQGMVNGHDIQMEDGEMTDSRPSITSSSETSEVPRVVSGSTPGSHPPRLVPVSGAQETMPPGSSGSQGSPTTSRPVVSASSTGSGDSSACLHDGRSGLTGGASGSGAPGPGEAARQMFPRAELDLGGAVYPMYQDMASRRRSFPHWDDRRAPPLDQMILCGMFYAGYADCVRCFYCGVGLKHWEVTDDVWVEHVRWRPSCGYLRAVKGDEYIRRTLARLGREAAGEEDGPPGQDRRDGDVRPGNGRATYTGPPRPQQDRALQDRRTPTARPTVAAPAHPAPAPTASTPSASSRNQTPTTPAPMTQTASPAPQSPSGVASQTTSSVGNSATPVTSATSSQGSCINQSGARPENAIRSDAQGEESQSQRVARLQAENRELARRLRCKVCVTEPIDTILMPCGHLVVCETCARNVTQCPLCRERIRATAKVHMN